MIFTFFQKTFSKKINLLIFHIPKQHVLRFFWPLENFADFPLAKKNHIFYKHIFIKYYGFSMIIPDYADNTVIETDIFYNNNF